MAKKASSKSSKVSKKAAPQRTKATPAVSAPKARPAKAILTKSPLGKSELQQYRKMLLEKRRSIVGDMTGIRSEALRTSRQDGSGDLSNMPTHPADIGTDNYEQEFTLGLLESERTLLKEIDEALERIDANTYGICLGTGKPINKERLNARPWAKYCIEYARMVEKGLVQPGRIEDEEEAPSQEESDEDEEIEEIEDAPDEAEE